MTIHLSTSCIKSDQGLKNVGKSPMRWENLLEGIGPPLPIKIRWLCQLSWKNQCFHFPNMWILFVLLVMSHLLSLRHVFMSRIFMLFDHWRNLSFPKKIVSIASSGQEKDSIGLLISGIKLFGRMNQNSISLDQMEISLYRDQRSQNGNASCEDVLFENLKSAWNYYKRWNHDSHWIYAETLWSCNSCKWRFYQVLIRERFQNSRKHYLI